MIIHTHTHSYKYLRMDASYRPALPVGHTAYSWSFLNQFESPVVTSDMSFKGIIAKTSAFNDEQTTVDTRSMKKRKVQQKPAVKTKSKKKKIIAHGLKKTMNEESKEDEPTFERRDHLLDIEKEIQLKWNKAKVFEANPNPGQEKFMVTL